MSSVIGNQTDFVNGDLTGSEIFTGRLSYRRMLKDILDRIEKRLEATRQSATKASLAAGLSEDAIRNVRRAVEDGREGLSTTTIFKLAPVLGTTASWLLEGVGAEASNIVPVMGYVGAGAEIYADYEQVPEDGLDQVEIPFSLPAEMEAYEVRGDSMLPRFRNGDVVIVFKEQRRPTESFFGDEAAVRLSDGRRFVKEIVRSGNSVMLFSTNARPIMDVEIEWIGEIFTIIPSTQLRRAMSRNLKWAAAE